MKVQSTDAIIVEGDVNGVSCTGGDNGHPKVWYSFEDDHKVICGYCDRTFVKKNTI